jgi:hypothetical protein
MHHALRLLLFLLSGCLLWSECYGIGIIQGPYNLPVAEVGIDYSYTFKVSEGLALPRSYYLYFTSRLPDGLTITQSGELMGRPTRVATDNPFIVISRA